MNRKQLGAMGEQFALEYVQKLGMRIVARNWRCSSGELDLIAYEQNVLVFIEVRTRTVHSDAPQKFGSVLEAITPSKQLKVRKLAEIYAYKHKLTDQTIRFDVVLVEKVRDELRATHIRHAF